MYLPTNFDSILTKKYITDQKLDDITIRYVFREQRSFNTLYEGFNSKTDFQSRQYNINYKPDT